MPIKQHGWLLCGVYHTQDTRVRLLGQSQTNWNGYRSHFGLKIRLRRTALEMGSHLEHVMKSAQHVSAGVQTERFNISNSLSAGSIQVTQNAWTDETMFEQGENIWCWSPLFIFYSISVFICDIRLVCDLVCIDFVSNNDGLKWLFSLRSMDALVFAEYSTLKIQWQMPMSFLLNSICK